MNSTRNDKELRDPIKNFEYLWRTFDRNYGIFGPKKVDWDALYRVYRPRVTSQTTDDELFDIMASMLGHLNDNHVLLVDGPLEGSEAPRRFYRAGILGELLAQKLRTLRRKGINDKDAFEIAQRDEEFSLDLIKGKYLKGRFKQGVGNVFHYGWLTSQIGYFHFNSFTRLEDSVAAVDEIILEFKDASGIVVDVRYNGGGADPVGKVIAGRFADRKRLYMKSRIRKGPGHGDFTPPRYWYVEPEGPIQFTKPVILLIDRHSVSAAETFTLAMRVLPHVSVVGSLTSGCQADVYWDQLPNGWHFSVPYKLFVDHEGFCWEGIGIPADIHQANTEEDIEQGRDKVLELAVVLLDMGELKLQQEDSSLKEIRESLAKTLANAVSEKGINAAVKAFYEAKSRNPDTYYVDQEEMDMLGQQLLQSKRVQEAIEVFKIIVQEFPESWKAYDSLGEAYLKNGDLDLARENYKKSLELNPRQYPWEMQVFEERLRLVKNLER